MIGRWRPPPGWTVASISAGTPTTTARTSPAAARRWARWVWVVRRRAIARSAPGSDQAVDDLDWIGEGRAALDRWQRDRSSSVHRVGNGEVECERHRYPRARLRPAVGHFTGDRLVDVGGRAVLQAVGVCLGGRVRGLPGHAK